jgi:hypothetical protein
MLAVRGFEVVHGSQPMTHVEGTATLAERGTMAAGHSPMPIVIPVERRRRAFTVGHEAVCMRCGHGESLHPQRDLACLLCDQRASAGLMSHFCVGFLSDRAAPAVH